MTDHKSQSNHFGFLPKCVQDELQQLYGELDILESKRASLKKQLTNTQNKSQKRKIKKKLSQVNTAIKELIPSQSEVNESEDDANDQSE